MSTETWIFRIASLVAVLSPPLSSWWHVVSDPAAQRRQTYAAGLTEIERRRVIANSQEFFQLPPEQQNVYRQLDQEIRGDAELSEQFQTYMAWYSTLSPGQREDLRKATDRGAKIAKIREFREEQQKELDEQLVRPQDELEARRERLAAFSLPGDDLRDVLSLLSNSALSQNLPADAMNSPRTLAEFFERISQRLTTTVAPLPNEVKLLDEAILLLSDQRQADYLRSLPPFDRRRTFFHLLFNSVMLQAVDAMRAAVPTTDEMVATLAKLPAEKREQLLQRPAPEVRRELGLMALENSTDVRNQNTAIAVRKLLQLQRSVSERNGGFWGQMLRRVPRNAFTRSPRADGARGDRPAPPPPSDVGAPP